jgi:polyphenol oxidase
VIPVQQHTLRPGVRGWFTGRDRDAPPVSIGGQGNLAHRRPHRPGDLAAARREMAVATGTDATRWHLLQQVHGRQVGVVERSVPPGRELRGVDAAVTALPGRVLAVQSADCVPVLLAAPGAIGVAHAGRAGVLQGVIPAVVTALRQLAQPGPLVAVLGPAIGGCCYEVPPELRAEAEAGQPGIGALTTWGTPSLDLPRAVRTQLAAAGVDVLGEAAPCTYGDERYFSHRRDPASGRQFGLVVMAPAGEVAA